MKQSLFSSYTSLALDPYCNQQSILASHATGHGRREHFQ